jgi:hypothetical protein
MVHDPFVRSFLVFHLLVALLAGLDNPFSQLPIHCFDIIQL